MSKSIYELIRDVRNHPDFLFGAIFTSDDLAAIGTKVDQSYNDSDAEEALVMAGYAYLESHSVKKEGISNEQA